MPVIRSAKKKLKVDRKRESSNKKAESFINLVIKKTQRKPTSENMQIAFKAIDKGVKKDIFHKNKAARIKSRLAKLRIKKPPSSTGYKPSKIIKTNHPIIKISQIVFFSGKSWKCSLGNTKANQRNRSEHKGLG